MHKLNIVPLFVAMVATQSPDLISQSGLSGFPTRGQFSPYYQNPYSSSSSYAGPQIPILRQFSNAEPGLSYQWGFETANGITAEESANIIPVGPELAEKQVTGRYGYTSPEGIPINVQYVADGNGFRPQVLIQGGYPLPGHVQQP
ncbi:hypothetical protein RI129_005053 [Pyrocoelia pectoralis]|uniref:Uncharacterized protein n=1 Tax=Pyrocoelia pectoralis TaxID=417401 RepID=A0AAN7VM16_9COLE